MSERIATRDSADRIRVFIGTEPKTEIARKVLQLSIERRTECPVEFTAMLGKDWEYSLDGITVGTGFSLRRWMIPAFCGWQGRAIYLDADQLVLGDIRDLWTMPERVKNPAGVSCWATYQQCKFFPENVPNTSVMVIDCAAAKSQWYWHLPMVLKYLKTNREKIDYAKFMYAIDMKPQPLQIPTEWNHLNVYKKDKTKLLHYTKEPEQPWYRPDHPLAGIWQKELLVAIGNGVIGDIEFEAALENWNVKQDWRSTNGLHPFYSSFLKDFPGYRARKKNKL